MTKYYLLIPVILLNLATYSQNLIPTKNQIEKFRNTQTYVVLDQNLFCGYNFVIEDVMRQNWTLTDITFITYKDFLRNMNDHGKSFLFVSEAEINNDNSGSVFQIMNLVLSGGNNINELEQIAFAPIAYSDSEEESYLYKLPTIIRFMENFIKKCETDESIKRTNLLSKFSNKEVLKNKTLFLVKNDLDRSIRSETKIKEFYPFSTSIIETEQLEKLIANNDQDAAILFLITPKSKKKGLWFLKVITNISGSEIYFFEYSKISKRKSGTFSTDDFQKIAN